MLDGTLPTGNHEKKKSSSVASVYDTVNFPKGNYFED